EGELPLFTEEAPNTEDLAPNTEDFTPNTEDLAPNTEDLAPNTGELPSVLQQQLDALTPKARKGTVRPLLVWLCALRPYTAEQLAELLNRQVAALRSAHLNPLREQEEL